MHGTLLLDSDVEVSAEVTVVSTDLDNNKMVVDGGEWSTSNQSEVWSSTVTDALPNFPGTNGFDGDFETAALNNTTNVKWDATSFGLSGVLRVVYNTGNYALGDVTNNGVSLTPVLEEEASPDHSWYNFGNVTLGQMEFGGSASYRGFYAIEVNGKLLVDSGVGDSGDDHVEYQTNGGEGTIVSVNTDDNTILLSDTGDRDNRWIAENKADTDFYVAGPSVTDDPLLTADVELKSSNFATTPADADTLKNIVWELNGTTQDAGTSNPYKPTGLATQH